MGTFGPVLLPETHRLVCFGVEKPFGILLSDEETPLGMPMEPEVRGPDSCSLGEGARQPEGYTLSFQDHRGGQIL